MLHEVTIFDRLPFARVHPNNTPAAALLRPIRTDQGPLNETIVRKGDDDSLVGDEILNGNLAFGTYDLCAPFGGMLALDRPELSLDDLQDACFFGNDVGEVFNGFAQGVVLLF